MLVIGFIYLLSLGPVERYVVKVKSSTSSTTTNATTHQTAITKTMTISYPGWVRTIYRPAFLVRASVGGNSLYARYLEWWQERRRPK